MKVVAGIDVGKTSLDVSVSAGPVRCFDNTPEALAGLQSWLRSQAVTDVLRRRRKQLVDQRIQERLAALSAIRYNDDLRRFYQGLRERGKTGKGAGVAVMRKLLLLLNAIAQRRTPGVEHHTPAS